jgi:DDE superfamily endonuclease
MPMPTFPLARLGGFRAELHACLTRRADALFELGDALLCAQAVPSPPHLSLEPVCRRGWGSVYAALARGRVDTERLRNLLVSSLPAADPLVFAVDVTTWPRCDAECSPERGYYYHPSGTRPASRSSPAGRSSGSASWASPGTPGPRRWMPAGCTRPTTPTRPLRARSARWLAA